MSERDIADLLAPGYFSGAPTTKEITNEARAEILRLRARVAELEARVVEEVRLAGLAATEAMKFQARVAALEAEMDRMGKTGAERYWEAEARWRDEAKRVESLEVERGIYRSLALRHEVRIAEYQRQLDEFRKSSDPKEVMPNQSGGHTTEPVPSDNAQPRPAQSPAGADGDCPADDGGMHCGCWYEGGVCCDCGQPR